MDGDIDCIRGVVKMASQYIGDTVYDHLSFIYITINIVEYWVDLLHRMNDTSKHTNVLFHGRKAGEQAYLFTT